MAQASASTQTQSTGASGVPLALLALDAAIELGNKLQGREGSTERVTLLGQKLRTTPGLDDNPDTIKALMSPTTVAGLSFALSESSGKELESIVQLVKEIKNLASQLENPASSTDEEVLRNLRAFCFALHREFSLRRRPTTREKDPMIKRW